MTARAGGLPARPTAPGRGPHRRARWGLITPPALFLGLFLLLPVGLMTIMSFRPDLRGGAFHWDWTPTLGHYRTVLGGDGYVPLLWTSVRVAMLVGMVAVVLAYPLAYFLALRAGRRASLLLTLLILPFWTSYLLRMIAWKIILGSNGAVNGLLRYLGLVDQPLSLLLYSRSAVVVTLVYVWLPFAALPIYAALLRMDRSLLEAAANLGARPAEAFLRVTLPLSLPGVLAGFLMVFIPTVGEYVAPLLVGGSQGSLYGNIVEIFFGDGINWPLGSAMALVMLGGVLAIFLLLARTLRIRRLVETP